MNFELTTNSAIPAIVIPTLKNARLSEHAHKMARIITGTYENVRRSSNALALILSDIDTNKLYEDDGYKSTADFAEKVLSIKKSTVSTLISTVKRFGTTAEDGTTQIKVPEGLEGQTAYNLYYLKDCSDDAISKAVKSGELSPTSTQKDIKAWAEVHSVKSADTDADTVSASAVLPMFTVSARFGATVIDSRDQMPEKDIAEYIKATFPANSYESKELSPIKCEDGTSIKRRIYIIDDGQNVSAAITVYYKLVKVPKAKKPAKAKILNPAAMSDDDLAAAIEEYNRRRATSDTDSAKAKARVAAAAEAAKK